jgi:hypothetical protein
MNLSIPSADPSRPPRLASLTGASPFKYYRVKAVGKGASGESDWSNVVSGPL